MRFLVDLNNELKKGKGDSINIEDVSDLIIKVFEILIKDFLVENGLEVFILRFFLNLVFYRYYLYKDLLEFLRGFVMNYLYIINFIK